MSKLDEILTFDSLADLPHETRALAKQKVQDLFLELMKDCEDYILGDSEEETRVFNEELYRKRIKSL